LKTRTRAFALRVIRLSASLNGSREANVIGHQLLRSGTSVGAHYREAARARSTAEFVSKLDVALMELEETVYWLELLAGAKILPTAKLESLQQECGELTAILVTCIKNAKRKERGGRPRV
jgi:four helix bundle protein